MFTIDSILSSKKKDDTVRRSDETQTRLSDDVETQVPLPSPIIDHAIPPLAKPLATRPPVIIEAPSGQTTPSISSHFFPSTLPSSDSELQRPQSSPLDLHAYVTTTASSSPVRRDLSNEDIDVCRTTPTLPGRPVRSFSPNQGNSPLISPPVFLSESDHVHRPYLTAAGQPASLQEGRYFPRQRASASLSSSNPSPSSEQLLSPTTYDYPEYPYPSAASLRYLIPNVNSLIPTATQIVGPRMVHSVPTLREISTPRLADPSYMRNLPSTSNLTMNPMFLRHLSERRHHLFDAGMF